MAKTPALGLSLGRAHRPGGRAAVVVLAGGNGSRLGGSVNKVYLPLAGRRVVSWSFRWAAQVPDVGHFVLVVRPEDAELATQTVQRECAGMPVELVLGGDSRHASEQAALDHLAARVASGAIEVIAIHDGARPLSGVGLFGSVIRTAAAVGGAVPALPATGLVPVAPGPVEGSDPEPEAITPPGGSPVPDRLVRVQTPQAFRAAPLLAAYRAARVAGYQGTDTACSLELHSGLAVQVVAGARHNLKVTYPHDLVLAERLLAAHHYQLR